MFQSLLIVGLGLLLQCLLACAVAWTFVYVASELLGDAAWSKGALVAAAGIGLSSGAVFASQGMHSLAVEYPAWVTFIVLVVMLSADYIGVLLAVRKRLDGRLAARMGISLGTGFIAQQLISVFR